MVQIQPSETLELSQNELKLLFAVINMAFQKGGLGIGDVINFAPLIQKIDSKIVKEKPEEGIVEPKQN